MISAFSGLSAGWAGGRGTFAPASGGFAGAVEPARVTVGSVTSLVLTLRSPRPSCVDATGLRIGHVARVSVREAEQPLGLLDDLGNGERLAADAVVALGVDQELRPD